MIRIKRAESFPCVATRFFFSHLAVTVFVKIFKPIDKI